MREDLKTYNLWKINLKMNLYFLNAIVKNLFMMIAINLLIINMNLSLLQLKNKKAKFKKISKNQVLKGYLSKN